MFDDILYIDRAVLSQFASLGKGCRNLHSGYVCRLQSANEVSLLV